MAGGSRDSRWAIGFLTRAKCVTQIMYRGPLPCAQGSNQDRVAAGACADCGMAADAATGQGGAWLRPLARGGKLQQTQMQGEHG